MNQKAVEIKNLSFSYPDGNEALKDISFDVSAGESLGIIGPNGAGKSTLILHLNGILRNKGSVIIFGLGMEDKNLPEIRADVGMVFQDPDSQLFMPEVFDDVSFGPINMGWDKKSVEEAVHQALKDVDMAYAERRLSHHLSFGEKKRVCLATVLSMKPRILALDEPSSNLDPRHRRDLINFLKKFSATKIIATHDLGLVLETCSRVILLDKGRIVAQGEASSILKDTNLLEKHNLE